MKTECAPVQIGFTRPGRRTVRGAFDGGHISLDGGAVLLREVDARLGITQKLAACFTDHRDPGLIEHDVTALVRQRVYGLALGYEDLNDHDDLKRDPLSAVALDKSDVQGEARHREADRGKVLASLVQRIRARWPHTRIILRGDSGFARDALMDWCESHGVYYLLGLAKNKRLLQRIGKELGDAQLRHLVTGMAARVFTAFDYRTQEY